MPRPRIHPRRKPIQPFSLVLDPAELAALRKIAQKERTSVAAVVRRAISTVLFQKSPELVDPMFEAELDGFLKRVGEKYPLTGLRGAKMNALKKQIRRSMTL